MTDSSRRRLLALLGTGATAVLTGCNRVFTQPDEEDAPTPPASPSVPDLTETSTETSTPTQTPSLAAVGTVVTVPNYDLSVTYRPVDNITVVDVTLDLRNVSGRDIRIVDIRVDLVFDPDGEDRVVAVDYVGLRGLEDGTVETLHYETRYSNEEGTRSAPDAADFDLVFRVREVEYA
jgi:hypothetical protein